MWAHRCRFCSHWLNLCQAGGVVPLGELAAQFNLGSELLMSVATPRIGKTIHGRLEGGLLYTSAYIARIKAQVLYAPILLIYASSSAASPFLHMQPSRVDHAWCFDIFSMPANARNGCSTVNGKIFWA